MLKPKRKWIIFQPSIFRGELLVLGRVHDIWCNYPPKEKQSLISIQFHFVPIESSFHSELMENYIRCTMYQCTLSWNSIDIHHHISKYPMCSGQGQASQHTIAKDWSRSRLSKPCQKLHPQKKYPGDNAIVHSIKNLCGESSTPLAKVPRNRGSNQVCLLSRNRRKMDVKSTEVTFEH